MTIAITPAERLLTWPPQEEDRRRAGDEWGSSEPFGGQTSVALWLTLQLLSTTPRPQRIARKIMCRGRGYAPN